MCGSTKVYIRKKQPYASRIDIFFHRKTETHLDATFASLPLCVCVVQIELCVSLGAFLGGWRRGSGWHPERGTVRAEHGARRNQS